jgi:hypothetical protein
MQKIYTEPIFETLAERRAQLVAHPFFAAGELLVEFAFHQYSDSIVWIPMLAQMKSKAERSPRLRRAIEDNIAHEAGIGGESHVTLAVAMMRSLGVRSLSALPRETLAESAALWLSDDFAAFLTEPAIAGFLLGAETWVPAMFAAALPAFERIGADTRYLREHVAVDSDEHAVWMKEAVEDVFDAYGAASIPEIMRGMNDAWEETIEVPNALWRKQCASR